MQTTSGSVRFIARVKSDQKKIGALPAVWFSRFLFFSSNIAAGVPGRHGGVCHDVERARDGVHGCFSCGPSLSWFVCIVSCKIEVGASGRHESFSPYNEGRAEGSSTVARFFAVRLLSFFFFWFVFFYVGTSKEDND